MRAYVLAGGQSRRMGCDKARLPCEGLAMAARVAEAFTEAGLEVALVRRVDDGLPWVDRRGRRLRVVYEPPHDGSHPLYGVAEAVRDAAGEAVCVAPCDLVGLGPTEVLSLVGAGEAVAVDEDGRRHPLLACWSGGRFLAEELVGSAARGEAVGRVFSALPGLPMPTRVLVNVNRPDDRPRSPLSAWAQSLPAGLDVARIIEGEGIRQRARGIVDGVSSGREEGR